MKLADYPVVSPWDPEEIADGRRTLACKAFRFYLGTHEVAWLAQTDVPLFVSRSRLRLRRRWPRGRGRWALDSGAFSELAKHGRWTLSARDYVAEVRRYAEAIGPMDFAAPQDWMVEPAMLARTGLTITDHQRLTTENYLELRSLAPDLPFIPVLRGWTLDDYAAHWEQYEAAGIDLTRLPLVGVGSVCRRQGTGEIRELLDFLAAFGVRAHGFGVKTAGLRLAAQYLMSADSMAWSFDGRWTRGCGRGNCANCLHHALAWRERIFRGGPEQLTLLP